VGTFQMHRIQHAASAGYFDVVAGLVRDLRDRIRRPQKKIISGCCCRTPMLNPDYVDADAEPRFTSCRRSHSNNARSAPAGRPTASHNNKTAVA